MSTHIDINERSHGMTNTMIRLTPDEVRACSAAISRAGIVHCFHNSNDSCRWLIFCQHADMERMNRIIDDTLDTVPNLNHLRPGRLPD